MVDLNDVADTLNEYSSKNDYKALSGFIDCTNDRTPSALGAGAAKEVLEEHGAIMVKARMIDGAMRMWFADLQREEYEVTETRERYTF